MAGGVITTGDNARLLQDGVANVFGQAYDKHPTEWNDLFNEEQSDKAFELDVQHEGFGLATLKEEGAGVNYDSQQEGFTPKYPMLTFAKGFIVTEENMDDNRYDLFNKRALALAFSMQQTKEVNAANVYNRATNSAFLMTGGDGVELLSQLHVNGPSDATTASNELVVPAPLTEASLEDITIQISEATDPRGLRIALQAERLIVPPKLIYTADRITKSVLQSGTNNNDINAMRNISVLRQGYSVNHYLTSDTAWFVKTNSPDGMKYWTRKAVDFQQDNDFDTSNMRFKAVERYAFGWTDWRGLYGTAGA